ncbi:MAG: HesA/MoeB/ThiF family protein [Bacteroidota bacterium]
MTSTVFSGNEWLRYTRHLQLPQVGVQGQSRLKQSHVVIIGAGGLGSPVALYLAAAGVGTLTIVDGDQVELSNLQRQILFTEKDIGTSKSKVAQQRLTDLNSAIVVQAIEHQFSRANADKLVAGADLVMDCTDNFATRYLINDTCLRYKKPWVFASIYQFSGQCALFVPGQNSACFRCLFPQAPADLPDCNSGGVIGVLPGLLGTLQAGEAIKYLVGIDTTLANTLLIVESLDLSISKIRLSKNPQCECNATVKLTEQPVTDRADYKLACASEVLNDIEMDAVSVRKAREQAEVLLLDVRSESERYGFHIGGLHIPLEQLQNHCSNLPKHKKIICYCQTGSRSQKAALSLCEYGFDAKSVAGGLVRYLALAVND